MDTMITLILVPLLLVFTFKVLFRIPFIGELLIGVGVIGGLLMFAYLAYILLASGDGVQIFLGVCLVLFLLTPLLAVIISVIDHRDKKPQRERQRKMEDEIPELLEYHTQKQKELKERNSK